MLSNKSHQGKQVVFAVLFLCAVVPKLCFAQTLINYDKVSFVEVPLNYQLGAGSLQIEGALELAYQSENDGLAEYDSQQLEGFLSYRAQLANDWDVGVTYRANYDTERPDSSTDELRAFVQDQWGLVSIGNVSTQLYDQTRRQLAFGLLGADRDNFTLPLSDYGGFYQWATSDTQWMLAVDSDANVEVGVVYVKPVGFIDYKFSLRANKNENEDGDAQAVHRSSGVAALAQIETGRWIVDAQLMSERVTLLDGITELDLRSVSAGIHAKFDLLGVSLTGVSRDNELSDTERSISLGFRYDLSRGLSLNLGANLISAKSSREKFANYRASIQYQF